MQWLGPPVFNRNTDIAVTATSRLAEVYYSDPPSLTAAQIAEGRPYSKAFVAKVLTALSQVGIVKGTSGRKGGYSLARPPKEITLLDITRCFQRIDETSLCPFNKGECARVTPCPLHYGLSEIQEHQLRFLTETSLAVFVAESRDEDVTEPV